MDDPKYQAANDIAMLIIKNDDNKFNAKKEDFPKF